MKKWFKKVVIGFGVALVVVVLALVVIAGFFQDAVGKKLITEINKQLTTELVVGDFDLSLLRGFPNATASLKDVVLKGKFDDGLLEAKEVSFHFGLLSLFGSQVKVHAVTIRDGALSIHVDKKGRANYDIFKPSEDDSDSKFSIALESASLENIELVYQDDKADMATSMVVREAKVAGEFSSENYDLTSTAKLTSSFIDMGGLRYFAGQDWSYNANIHVDVATGLYTFDKVKVSVDNNDFKVEGTVKDSDKTSEYDLTATAEDANLESIIALMPEQQLNMFGDFSSQGKFQFLATVNGRMSANESPAVDVSVSLEDGKLTSPRLKEPFKDVSFRAEFSNGSSRTASTSSFQVSEFKGYLNRELMTMSLDIQNLDDPFIDLQADGAMPMGYIYGLFGNPTITDGSGEIEFRNLKLKGRYSDMASMRNVIAVEMSGFIGFDDAGLTVNSEKMIADRGGIRFQGNLIQLEELKLEAAGGEINLKGNVQNLLPVLFADSLNSQDAKLFFTGELNVPKIDLGRLVKMTDISVEEGDVGTQVFDSLKVEKFAKRERITDFLQGTFTAHIDKFIYDRIEGQGFVGKLTFQDGQLRIDGRAQGMEGRFELDGTVFFEQAPRMEAKVSGSSINVKQFFYQTNNFGQQVLTYESLEGTLNTKMLIHAFWDSTGNFLMDDLHVWAGLGIESGELKGFKMLEEFSTYANVSDLRHVRFTDMQNWIEVTNSKVILPVMFLQNNAMNLTVSGEQTFDDKIDYGIKVNAGQVLSGKFKRGNSRLEPIKAKKSGFFNLYFNVYGTLDKFDYGTNKRKVKEMFDRSEKQKREIRAVLIGAFGAPLNMLREPDEWLDEGETANWSNDDDVEYIEGF